MRVLRFKTKINPIIVHNIWTLEYTHDLFHFVTVPPTITRERGIRYFDTEAGVCAEISRRIVCPIGRELGSIMFEVECTLAEFGNSRYFFIMIEEVEGAMSIVDVLRVYRPKFHRIRVTNGLSSIVEFVPLERLCHARTESMAPPASWAAKALPSCCWRSVIISPGCTIQETVKILEISERYPGSLSGIMRLTRKCASFLSITSGHSITYEWPRLSLKDPPAWAMANVFSLRPTSVLILFVLPTASCVD